MSSKPSLFLPRHVLAHLRAVAEGIPHGESARRFLLASPAGARAAHRAAAASAALFARRVGLGARWRLLLLDPAPALLESLPPLEEWAEANGYSGFCLDEQMHAYEQARIDQRGERKSRQLARLRAGRMALLEELEAFSADPSPSDPVSRWFDPPLAPALQNAGFLMLGELRDAISKGGRWWSGLPAYGPTKAARLAAQIDALLGVPPPPDWRDAAGLDEAHALIEWWVKARTQSEQTARAYRRETQRFAMWLAIERDKVLDTADSGDCSAYVGFLRAVPVAWQSKRHAARFESGWAPFSKQPTVSSQRYALNVLTAFFSHLVADGQLPKNPWASLSLRLPDDPGEPLEESRAFTPEAWHALSAHVSRLPAADAARMRWLLAFGQATGLRAAELLNAKRGDFSRRDGAHWLLVHGKGARNRRVMVPSSAVAATCDYFDARGLSFDLAHPHTPLLAVLQMPALPGTDAPDPTRPLPELTEDLRHSRGYLSYSTAYKSFTRFARAAIAASDLPVQVRLGALRASLHWLRHTHATRAAEADAPADVLQAQLGHADPRTTARYFRAQDKRRQKELERVFGN